MHKLDFFDENGFVIVKKFLSRKKCNEIIDKLKNIKKIRKKKNLFVGDARTEVIFNFFFEDLSLLKLISNRTIN
jgi:hypothetical protein